MFSTSSSNNKDRDTDCFGSRNGFIQIGSSSSPAFLEEDQFFMNNFLSISQGQQHFFLEEGNPYQLTLLDYDHNFVDRVMVAGNFDDKDQISCDIVVGEEVGPGHTTPTKAIGGSCNDEINEKDSQPVKRPAKTKRIRTGKKDRHSKICTAQGPRDRRMRLSLQTARKFFDLQDKLGFDKASKTIEWLFNMSKQAVRDVMGNTYSRPNEPNRSDGATKISTDNNDWRKWRNHLVSPENEDFCLLKFGHITNNLKTYNFEDCQYNKLKRINKHCRSISKKLNSTESIQVANWPQLKKVVRDKARARARERTLEKMRLKAMKDPNHASLTTSYNSTATANPSCHSYSGQIGSCRAIEHVDSSGPQSRSVEEMIREEWDQEIEDARLYSRYMLHDTTPGQLVLNSGINCHEQSPATISFMNSASQAYTNQLCLSTTTSTNEYE